MYRIIIIMLSNAH